LKDDDDDDDDDDLYCSNYYDPITTGSTTSWIARTPVGSTFTENKRHTNIRSQNEV
jgi:hypothetical protein